MKLWEILLVVALGGGLGYVAVDTLVITPRRADCEVNKGGKYICGEHRCFCFAPGVVLP